MSRYVDIDLLIARLKEHSPQTSKVKVAQIATKGVPVIELEPNMGNGKTIKTNTAVLTAEKL